MTSSSPMLANSANSDTTPHRQRSNRLKKSESELIQLFWNAPMEAFFGQEIVAPVTSRQIKTLECDRWRGRGIPYRKCAGRVLYRKSDIIAWLEGHELVSSTSEYRVEDNKDAA